MIKNIQNIVVNIDFNYTLENIKWTSVKREESLASCKILVRC
jgi:hypothetical protein